MIVAVRSFLSRCAAGTFRLLERCNLRWSSVPVTPFLDPGCFEWVERVESRSAQIAAELAGVQGAVLVPNFQDVEPNQRRLTDDDRWKTFFLYVGGRRIDHNAVRCPNTDDALAAIPGMRTAFFSILSPGKEIPVHRGPYNGVLRYHLGVRVPSDASSCGIRVGDETRQWATGSSLIFDDTFQHEAWNHSGEERTVLFVDFERPLRGPMRLVNRTFNSAVLWSPPARRFLAALGGVDDAAAAPAA